MSTIVLLGIMMMYHKTKRGSERIRNSEDSMQRQSYFDYIGPHCDFSLEDSK